MKPKVYIDGKAGTTGLEIYDRLSSRDDIELITISDEKRKDIGERGKYLSEADLVFLCLPDGVARETAELIGDSDTKLIDASNAHRTAAGWTYGLPELRLREEIARSKRVANPGCHATGFLSIVAPLISCKVIRPEQALACYSISGYSGGGNKMICEYEAPSRRESLNAPRIYGLDLNHKHIPEMMAISGLTTKPIFTPIVDDYYRGMLTTVMLDNSTLNSGPSAEDIRDILAAYYADEKFIIVSPFAGSATIVSANKMANSNLLAIKIYGDDRQTVLTAQFDNLGKGASGAAVQNMNIMLGLDETAGLID